MPVQPSPLILHPLHAFHLRSLHVSIKPYGHINDELTLHRCAVLRPQEGKNKKGATRLPLDLRAKKTRALRKALTKEQKEAKTLRAQKKAAAFPRRKYALKA